MSASSLGLVKVIAVDYSDPVQGNDLIQLMNHYAQDPMGGGEALGMETQRTLVRRLHAFPTAYSWLAYRQGIAVGLLNAFLGLSTFKSQPLLNIHDVVVHKQARGQGISRLLFDAAEAQAKALGCCKVTLEVLTGNQRAKQAYRAFGYEPYQLDAQMGIAEFWQKSLEE